jgi:hypothetical protein
VEDLKTGLPHKLMALLPWNSLPCLDRRERADQEEPIWRMRRPTESRIINRTPSLAQNEAERRSRFATCRGENRGDDARAETPKKSYLRKEKLR